MKIINLFNYDEKLPKPSEKITYSGLNIHQKINYRANLCVFCGSPYKNRYKYFDEPLLRPIFKILTKDYFTHYRLNSGRFNRLNIHLKSKQKTLFN